MPASPNAFLTARWQQLAMLNFDVDPALLHPWLPAGVELDTWNGRTFVSLVGFWFLDTRLWGVPIPGHRNFPEVNLRFYVRRQAAEGWRRGVVFVKELVPRPAIAWTARLLYGENYVALPMHAATDPATVRYSWRWRGHENYLQLTAGGDATLPTPDSLPAFIVEHYWGYARRRNGSTVEYRVAHPSWLVQPVAAWEIVCDAATLYGPVFADVLRTPSSALLAVGSSVTVYHGQRLALELP
ncbi:MAG: DUF2071 domain-containing protein [Anaerolineae bacterium]